MIGRLISRTALILVVVLTSACGQAPSGPDLSPLGPVAKITELPRALSASESAVIEGNTRFGLELLKAVASGVEGGGNVVLSPLSASMALGMALEGAEGNTFVEMRELLGFGGLHREEITASYRSLLDLLYDLDRTVTFRISNSAWHREEFSMEADFVDAVRAYFDAEIEGVDFSSSEAVRRINDWVRRATEGRIEDILQPPVDPDMVMLLLNAIHFKGAWTYQFDPARTRSGEFKLGDGRGVLVPMMAREEGPVRYSLGSSPEDYTAVELPYGGEAYAMTVVLPPMRADLHAFAASLDGERWQGIVESLRNGKAEVELPRFRLEYEKTLNGLLQALGVHDAFDPWRADFTRMYRHARGVRLRIQEVRHKAWVDVNEQGTEAAAATSVGMVLVSGPVRIRIDRPFLFAIRERLSGTLLFIGLVEDPRS